MRTSVIYSNTPRRAIAKGTALLAAVFKVPTDTGIIDKKTDNANIDQTPMRLFSERDSKNRRQHTTNYNEQCIKKHHVVEIRSVVMISTMYHISMDRRK